MWIISDQPAVEKNSNKLPAIYINVYKLHKSMQLPIDIANTYRPVLRVRHFQAVNKKAWLIPCQP